MRLKLIIALIAAALLIGLPPLLGLGWQNTLVNMLVASLFAASFNLLMGQAGMLSFGHAAYFGIGAFAVLHLMRAVENGLPIPTPLLPLAGGIAGLLAGLGSGYFATRRTGVYFSLVTLALAELLHSLSPHWEGVFGGEAGLSSMRMPSLGLTFGSILEVYYLTLAWVVVAIALLYAYTRTPFGRLTLALRDNEQRVRFMGYDPHTTKVLIFGIAAMFAGIAGGLAAMSSETANYNVFSMHASAQVVLHTFVGGSALFLGPVLGASLLTLFTFLVSELTHSWLLYQGLLFVLVMLFAPHGIGGVIHSHIANRHRLPWAHLAAPYAVSAAGAALVTAGAVFLIQAAEVLFSQAYRAKLARSAGWDPIPLFGHAWHPADPLTWLLPLLALGLGGVILLRVRGTIVRLWSEDRPATAQPQTPTPVAPARRAA